MKSKTGIEMITAERRRQIDKEKWTAEHDDDHDFGELAEAAAIYALPKDSRFIEFHYIGMDFTVDLAKRLWPWDEDSYKPTPKNRIKELAKAGALIAAEIDRLKRLAHS